MERLPTQYYYVLNRDRNVTLRFQGSLLPRVGDTIKIAGSYLKVVDVVIEFSQSDGAAAENSFCVHAEDRETPFDDSRCEELEIDEYVKRME